MLSLTGHFVVVCGYNRAKGAVFYKNPSCEEGKKILKMSIRFDDIHPFQSQRCNLLSDILFLLWSTCAAAIISFIHNALY